MIANNSLARLSELIDLGPLNASLDLLLGPAAEYIDIADFFESEEGGVLSYTLVLGVKRDILFHVPGMPAIQLGIVNDSPDEWPLILCEMVVSGSAQGVSIRHFPLRVVIDNPLLLPVPADGDAESLDGFSFELEGSLNISVDLTLEAELESFSLPPFIIAGTGIAMGLQECRLILRDEDVDSEIEALGFEQGFRGFQAASAQFFWDIPFQLNGTDLAGIKADLHNVALGNQGVSVTAILEWDVAFDGNNIDPTQSEIVGELFDSGWQCALEKLEVVIERNVPIGTIGVGYLRIPYFEQVAKLELGYQYKSPNKYEFAIALSQLEQRKLNVDLGHIDYQLQISDFQLNGRFTSEGEFELQGQGGLVLALPNINVVAESVQIKYEHTEEQDNLLISMTNIQVDDYGHIDEAQLVVVMLKDDEGEYQLALLELVSKVQWQDISSRIALEGNTGWLPMPPDEALVNLNLSWSDDVANFSISAELEDVDQLWRFIPEAFRPEVDNASLDIQLTVANGDFDGELGVECLLRLPDFAQMEAIQIAGLSDFIELESGDDEGWVSLRFSAELSAADEDDESHSAGKIGASLENPISIGLQLPGLLLPEAPIVIDINKISLALDGEGDELGGEISLEGDFELYPILPDSLNGFVPPAIALQLDRLLAIAKQIELSGNASLTLGISDNVYFEAKCVFEQAALELDLFDIFSSALVGSTNLFGNGQGSDIDLDIEVSVRLQEIYIKLGSEEPSDDQTIPFAFGFNTLLNFANVVDFPFEFTLTDESLSFGLSELSIPLAIPELPLSLEDLNQLKDASGRWNITDNWQSSLLPALETDITEKSEALDQAQALLADLLEYSEENATQIFQQQYREIPKIQATLFDLAGRKFLFEAILFVFQNMAEDSRDTYQQYVEIYQGAIDSALGWISADTQLRFEIEDAKFVLPFNNPSDIKVEGKASIGGVEPNSIFAPLADLSFKLGISADAIYFAVEGGATPIPLPDFGRYPGSAVKIDKILIGYGYSKNSLKIDFAGELILSEQLIDDADTSAGLGFGVRLPNNSKLGFKLDLIPVVLGEVDFVIPLVAFDIDLTSEVPPPAPATDGKCNPSWDGLQLIIPSVMRADLKKFKYSPFFGPVPASNAEYAYDLQLGDENLGLTHIADYSIILPLLNTIPVPFLMDGSPFFQRLCSNIQLAGFGLSFDLTRPFPHPSPLLVFELLGFIADPDAGIDPNGYIANIMYADLYHGRVSLPPAVMAMFPSLGGIVNIDYAGRINVATVIALAQNIQGLATELLSKIAADTQQGLNWLEDALQNPPLVHVSKILNLLPIEMRLVQLQGRLVHFDADATFVLALASDINQQLGETDTPDTGLSDSFESVYKNDFSSEELSSWTSYHYGLKRGKGRWHVKDGMLLQDNNVGDNSPARYGAMLVCGEAQVENGRIEVQSLSSDNDGLGVVFHFQSKDTFYRFRMTKEQKEWRLDKIRKGDIDTLFSTHSTFKQYRRYKIRIDVSSKPISSLAFGLPKGSPFSKSRIDHDLAPIRSVKSVKAMQTQIKIWVNGKLWCDVVDDIKPLISGKAGVDSWWNNGAYFDNFELFKVIDNSIRLNTIPSARQLPQLNQRLSNTATSLGDIFVEFTPEDISAALDDSSDISVVMKARVSAFEQTLLLMLGSIDLEGRFSLFSSTDIDPLSLTVLGIDIPIPIETVGRISLVGQKSGAQSFAKLQGSIVADWAIFPGPTADKALARLILGTHQTPARLSMNSTFGFAIHGQSELRLFCEQITVRGEVDISQAHVMMSGELDFSPGLQIAGQPIVVLSASVRGRLGPGDFVELLGEGHITLFGKGMIASGIEVGKGLVALNVATEISSHDSGWLIGGLPVKHVQIALSGSVDFSQPTPLLAFKGTGGFELFGASIKGDVQLELKGANWLLAAQGNMSWLGREWLAANILISNSGLEVHGRADFAIPLTASQLGGGLQIAGLFLHTSVSGVFKLNPQGQLIHWDLTVDWQLAVRLPGVGNNKQSFPVASQQIKATGAHQGYDEVVNIVELINFNGLTLFDFQGITLPIPQLDPNDSYKVYLHDSVDLGVESAEFSYPIFDLNPLDGFEEGTIEIQVPEIPIPIFSDKPQNTGDRPIFEVPKLTESSISLGKFRLEDQFELTLGWRTGQLGVVVNIAGETQFFPFDPLLTSFTGLVSLHLPDSDG